MSEIPFSEEVLKSCKDTHILVAVFPLSVRTIVKELSDRILFHSSNWYGYGFAKDNGEVGWQLVRKEHVADSTYKRWNEQQTLLSKDEETPKAQIVLYTMSGHFLSTGERLFEKIAVSSLDLVSDNRRVIIGFKSKSLNVGYWYGGFRSVNIGVSSARKRVSNS